MRRIVLGVVVTTLLAGAILVIATAYRSQPDFEEQLDGDPLATLVIAPATTAVTLARIASPEGGRVVLVTRAGPEGLDAVDLEAAFDRSFRDAVEAFAVLGFDALAGAAAGAPTLRISFESLGLPLDAGDAHVAAGTNYRAHAEELGREDGPFLFPKLTRPTPWNADVPLRARLDYEAEICAVPLTRHTASDPAPLGYLLCNDFTDRWTLVRHMRPDEPMGITGFADGKGGEGMLPVGALLVVPRDDDGFWRDLGLELYVGGRLRQRARGGQMIWSPAEIVSRAIEACDVDYHHQSGPVPLTDCDGIPPRTLVLTGTPGGVLFDVVTLWSPGAYLEPGDEVVTAATHLGILRNRVRRGR